MLDAKESRQMQLRTPLLEFLSIPQIRHCLEVDYVLKTELQSWLNVWAPWSGNHTESMVSSWLESRPQFSAVELYNDITVAGMTDAAALARTQLRLLAAAKIDVLLTGTELFKSNPEFGGEPYIVRTLSLENLAENSAGYKWARKQRFIKAGRWESWQNAKPTQENIVLLKELLADKNLLYAVEKALFPLLDTQEWEFIYSQMELTKPYLEWESTHGYPLLMEGIILDYDDLPQGIGLLVEKDWLETQGITLGLLGNAGVNIFINEICHNIVQGHKWPLEEKLWKQILDLHIRRLPASAHLLKRVSPVAAEHLR